MKIGVLGGTFNPPHIGHIDLATSARTELGLDKLIFIPAGSPPHKTLPVGSANTAERYEMACIAAEKAEAEVNRIEIEREGPSYTYDTLMALKSVYPNDRIYIIVGSDMFITLESWHEGDKILKNYPIVTAARHKNEKELLLDKKKLYEASYGSEIYVLSKHIVDISSSELRDAEGDFPDFIPEKLACYIKSKGLYTYGKRFR